MPPAPQRELKIKLHRNQKLFSPNEKINSAGAPWGQRNWLTTAFPVPSSGPISGVANYGLRAEYGPPAAFVNLLL